MNKPVLDPLRFEDFIYICLDVDGPEHYITIGEITKQEQDGEVFWFGHIKYNNSVMVADAQTPEEVFKKLLDLWDFNIEDKIDYDNLISLDDEKDLKKFLKETD